MLPRPLSAIGLGLCLASATLAWANTSGYVPTATVDPDQMQLTFDEPFDFLDVSPFGPGTRWIAHTPWMGDFGGARFANPVPNSPFQTENGELRIAATRDADGNWQSGLLASVDRDGIGFSQDYGYFEIRARLPQGAGLWPAFWLIGEDRSKFTAEVDVMEYRSDKPDGYSAVVHVWHREGEHYSDYKRVEAFSDADPTDYHTYGVWIDQDVMKFYFDRALVWETVTPPEQRQPRYLLLNLALVEEAEKDLAPNPSYMFVDYVRVYASE